MKLREWLLNKKNIPYDEYKSLDEIEKYCLQGEFQRYNANIQRIEALKRSGQLKTVTLTPEEQLEWDRKVAFEQKHRELSEKAGGIEGYGYIALHHRGN